MPHTILHGDPVEMMQGLPGCSVDAIVTMPPHDVPGVPVWQGALRVARPGAYLLALGTNRAHHRLMVAIEDAGWEIRDVIMHLFGLDYAPWVLARKPLEGTVADNVIAHGVGGLNIDACRVGTEKRDRLEAGYVRRGRTDEEVFSTGYGRPKDVNGTVTGRWPANITHDGSAAVVGLFPSEAGSNSITPGTHKSGEVFVGHSASGRGPTHDRNRGSAARFFYQADHPADLVRYLCRLITPPRGVVFDPFAGRGDTCKAAAAEGFAFVGVETK